MARIHFIERTLFNLLAFVVYVFVGSTLFANETVNLERQEYENARDIIIRMLEKYPPSKTNYVGIGRSMTPVMAILRELYPENSFVLPLSTMYHRPKEHAGYEAPLTTEVKNRLFEHFQRFLPQPAQTGGKETLFIDFAVGGGSAVATEEYLSEFAKERRPDIKPQMLIFSPVPKPEKIIEAKKNYDVISIRDYPVINQRWLFSWFDDRADYDRFSFPFLGSEKLEPNSHPARIQLLQKYRAYLRTDSKITNWMKSCNRFLERISNTSNPSP